MSVSYCHKIVKRNHRIPLLSYELQLENPNNKSRELTISTKKTSLTQLMISFNYTQINNYDRYMFTLRYHGRENYVSNLLVLTRHEPNVIILKEFPKAQYILCITLIASTNSVPPLSTSNMCVDFFFGEDFMIGYGYKHPKTGLISVILVIMTILHLIVIPIAYEYIDSKKPPRKQVKKNEYDLEKVETLKPNDESKRKSIHFKQKHKDIYLTYSSNLDRKMSSSVPELTSFKKSVEYLSSKKNLFFVNHSFDYANDSVFTLNLNDRSEFVNNLQYYLKQSEIIYDYEQI